MSDATKQIFSNVQSAIRAAVQTINSQIRELEAKRKALQAALGEGRTVTQSAKPAANKAARDKGTRGPGMLNVLLPWMEGKAGVKAGELLKQLHEHPEYRNTKANSLYATLAAEFKRPSPRIERTGDGAYRVSAAYFERDSRPQVAEQPSEPVSA